MGWTWDQLSNTRIVLSVVLGFTSQEHSNAKIV